MRSKDVVGERSDFCGEGFLFVRGEVAIPTLKTAGSKIQLQPSEQGAPDLFDDRQEEFELSFPEPSFQFVGVSGEGESHGVNDETFSSEPVKPPILPEFSFSVVIGGRRWGDAEQGEMFPKTIGREGQGGFSVGEILEQEEQIIAIVGGSFDKPLSEKRI